MNNKYSTLMWQVGNGIVAIVICYLTDSNYMYAPLIIPVLNLITKELNKALNPNYKEND